MRINFILKLLVILKICGLVVSLCELEKGESVLVLSILESNGTQFSQEKGLPINGSGSEISLQLLDNNGKFGLGVENNLKLLKPLDRDESDGTSISLRILCENRINGSKTIIPLLIRVLDINDNAPRFENLPYISQISESVPVGTTIFRNVVASDLDSGVNGLVEYYIVPSGNGSQGDEFGTFVIKYPQEGHVILNRRLDYEKIDKYLVIIEAKDQAATVSQRLTSTATLTINIEDSDDLDPAFIYEGCYLIGSSCANPEYHADIISGKVTGILAVKPGIIKAMDRDSFNNSIRFEFHGGTPESFRDYFVIDALTGQVRQIEPVDRKIAHEFSIIIKAEEQTEQRRFSTAKLTITVQASDDHCPQLKISSNEGYIEKSSPYGTFVTSSAFGSDAIRFSVIDEDLEPRDILPKYTFEMTTKSFVVNDNGELVLNDANLQQNNPEIERYNFQVVAREVDSGMATDPVSVTVHLIAVLLQNSSLEALHLSSYPNISDSLIEDNITARHSMSTTGFSERIFHENEQENANIHPQIFPSKFYQVSINEGAPINSWLLTVKGVEPRDGREITYSIIEGNDDGAFHLSPVTAVLSLRRTLDREQSGSRQLCVEARDLDGIADTADVHVEITDINDCNPTFIGQPYTFHVAEGLANALIGTVKANDEDSGIYGFVTYSVSADADFSVDPISGDIRTKNMLNYEEQPAHLLVITAKDGAYNPRIATATVTVIVDDVPDVLPVFPTKYYEATVSENVPAANIIQVSAIDADSFKEITYIIRDDPSRKFFIDPINGIIGSLQTLDFEERNSFEVVVGTLQNMGIGHDAACIVRIQVLDVNDIAPLFTSIPLPLRIPDSIKIGTTLTTVVAVDGDGSTPNNVVKYAMNRNDYFIVDQDTGDIRLWADLSQEKNNAMKIEVTAYDLGTPQLTTSITILVYVDHQRVVTPVNAIAFADTKFSVEVEENAVGNMIIKTMIVMHRTGPISVVNCVISEGNDLDHFYTETNNDGNCLLKTQGQKLDYEAIKKYNLVITLATKTGNIDPSRSTANVVIRVLDINDNRPQFVFKYPENQIIGRKYISGISSDAPAFTSFTKVEAVDNDSGFYGQLEYSLDGDSNVGHFFTVDKKTGIISNRRTFENLIPGDPPFNLTVIVRDWPDNITMSLNSTAQLVVNLIRDENRLILGITDTTPDIVKNKASAIIEIIQEQIHFITRLEKIDSRKVVNASKSTIDPSGTDVWFYVTDPESLSIMQSKNEAISKTFLEFPGERVFLYSMSGMVGIKANSIRTPEIVNPEAISKRTVIVNNEVDGFPAALIVLASIVAILSVVGIIYISLLWSKYSSKRNRIARMAITPRYESVFIESKPKPYETQVLQMNVPVDDDIIFEESIISGHHGHHQHFGRFKETTDNVSYTTKYTNDGSHSGVGNGSCSESDSFDGRGRHQLLANGKNNMVPVHNPVYHSGYSSDENGEHSREDGLRVHFGNTLSAVATTTEL